MAGWMKRRFQSCPVQGGGEVHARHAAPRNVRFVLATQFPCCRVVAERGRITLNFSSYDIHALR